jgi:hypothetical protein
MDSVRSFKRGSEALIVVSPQLREEGYAPGETLRGSLETYVERLKGKGV